MLVATQGALCTCTFGMIPTVLTPVPKMVTCSGMMALNITDILPVVNIPTFGMCKAPTNPAVLAIMAATLGQIQQAPCIPAVSSPWIPTKPTVLVGGMPVCSAGDFCMCKWLGQIFITFPGQLTVF